MTKVVLLGYGQMGKMIASIANEMDVEIVAKFDLSDNLDELDKIDFDVAIDFTTHRAIEDNLHKILSLGKSIVIGTTGWYDKIDSFKADTEAAHGSCVWGSNFSLGMQAFYKLLENAGHLMNTLDDYDIAIHETHHKLKKDSPSGSAIAIANILMDNIERKTQIEEETCHEQIDRDKLHVTSSRVGTVAGTHSVYFDSFADTIELTHRAKSRTGFAKGALLAAKWIAGKKGFYTFSEVFDDVIGA